MAESNLPTPDRAQKTLGELRKEAFFQRLASWGIVPQNEKQAQELLEMDAKLAQAEKQGTYRPGQGRAPTNGLIGRANSALDQAIGPQPGVKQAHDADREAAIKQAASQLAGRPDLFNAALAYRAGQAEQIRQQAGLS